MKKGFTLIELLVVIAIIGVLVGFTLTSFAGTQKQTRDTQRKNDLGQYRTALEAYGTAHDGVYPEYTTAITISSSNLCAADKLGGFISECLSDPKGGSSYVYKYITNSGGLVYKLWVNLEATDWWEVCSDGRSGKVSTEPTDYTCDL
jgi:prepilin-type N-terminal cleavage/methylation domain-containing protein